MDTTCGIITLLKFLCPTIASKNSSFFLLFEEKKWGFGFGNTNFARFFDFHTWKCHFTWPATVLALQSLQLLIKCSKQRFVPHILRRDGDPTASVSPQILGRITPTQFLPLCKALREIIFLTLQIFKLSRLPKLSNLQDFPNF